MYRSTSDHLAGGKSAVGQRDPEEQKGGSPVTGFPPFVHRP